MEGFPTIDGFPLFAKVLHLKSSMESNLGMPSLYVVGTVLLTVVISALLIRNIVEPLIRFRGRIVIKKMLEDANIVVGKDIVVHDERMWFDWVMNGMLGIGESYMAGQWEAVTPLDEVLTRLLSMPAAKKRKLFKSWNARFVHLAGRIFNYQSTARAGIVGAHHYDIGNDFYNLWLGPHLQYSCAYWKGARNLEEAQENKLKLIGDKLKLKRGMTVLEIGCGWGGLAVFLAKHYGVHVTGITISREQLKGAADHAAAQGVSHLTSFEYQDYRSMTGQFDRVVSIAMLEAVGYKNLDEYYQVIRRCLKDGGVSMVHSIGSNRSTKTAHQRWITKYIFPNGFLPSSKQMCEFAEKKLVVEDVQNLGPDYDKTLMAWNEGFQKAYAAGQVDKDIVFKRMWEFYLLYCAAGFRSRNIQLFQFIYSKFRYERYDAPRN